MEVTKTTKSLGTVIRNIRKSQGLTQEQLAAYSGTGRRFLGELEAGKESCHLGKTIRILAMLGLEICIREKEL